MRFARSTPRRRGGVLLSAAVLAGALTAVAPDAVTAHAAVPLALCSEDETVSYTPGLTNTPHTVTINITKNFTSCVTSEPRITSGSSTVSIKNVTRSCTDLLAPASGTFTVKWNTGQTSTISFTATSVYANGSLTVTELGTVTSGVFAGATVNNTVVLLASLTACTTAHGLTNLSGNGTLSIV